MTENKGTRADLPPEGGVDKIKYAEPEYHNPLDDDFENTGEGGDGQTERVPRGLS